LFCSATAR